MNYLPPYLLRPQGKRLLWDLVCRKVFKPGSYDPVVLPTHPHSVHFWLDEGRYVRIACNQTHVFVRAYSFPIMLNQYFNMKLDMIKWNEYNYVSISSPQYQLFIDDLNEVFSPKDK